MRAGDEGTFLKLVNIYKSFSGAKALRGVSLEIEKGEVHCLLGENGSGKSTLIKIVSGAVTADEGTIIINGHEYSKITPYHAIEEGIQVIYQDFSIYPNLTVMENIALNTELANRRKIVSKKRLRKIAEQALQRIECKLDLDEIVENLCVANKQLIAICRALYNNAKLIIMDEPTTALTQKEVDALFRVIKGLKKEGISVLFISHKLDEVFEISERFTIIRNGENIITGNVSDFDRQQFSFHMTGRKFEDLENSHDTVSGEKVLEVKNLHLKNAYHNISFELHKGEILGITGLLGSGRTELMETLFGRRRANSGEIFIDGKKVSIRSVQDAIRHGIGYVPEDRLTEGLFMPQPIKTNISVVRWGDLSKYNLLNNRAITEIAHNAVGTYHIVTEDVELPVQTLSGGNQQKTVLARWIVSDSKVLVLNGPTVGVDIGAKYDIHKIVRRLSEQGKSIIILSDDIPEILICCHRIIVMQSGLIKGIVHPQETDQTSLESLVVGR